MSNPLELADTILHESIHMALALREAGIRVPLPANVLDWKTDNRRADLGLPAIAWERRPMTREWVRATYGEGSAQECYLLDNYGFNPDKVKYIDINKNAQELIVAVLGKILEHKGVPKSAKKTATFENVEMLRRRGERDR